MNKYQEALNFLDWHCEVAHTEQQELLQELVDRATPVKPINTIRCANCGGNKVKEYLTDTYGDFEGILNYSYCGDCGQKIDWSDEE